MFISRPRPVVHPMQVAAPAPPPPPPEGPVQQQQPPPAGPVQQQPPAGLVQQPPGVLMKDLPGMPGTPGGLGLRVAQLLFAATSLAVMSSTVDFASVSAFWYLVAGAILQCAWSLFVAIVDIYAILVKRCLRNRRAASLFAIGDGITWAVTFSGACSSAAITTLINMDLNMCSENHCGSFQTSVAMAFMCWLSLSPSFILNLHLMASSRA